MKKRILKFFSVLIFILIIYFSKPNVDASEISKTGENFKEVETFETDLDIDKILGINENTFVYEKNQNIILNIGTNKIDIGNGTLTSATSFEQMIYCSVNIDEGSYIYLYDLSNNYANSLFLKSVKIEFIQVVDKMLVGVGSKDGDAYLIAIDYYLNILREKSYGGDGQEEFLNFIYYNNSFFASVFKDGLSNDGPFISTGNIGEKRSALVKLDINFNLLNTFYFNEKTSCEKIIDLNISQGMINCILETPTKKFLYSFNSTLENINYQEVGDSLKLLSNYKSDFNFLFYDLTNNKIIKKGIDNPQEEVYSLTNFGEVQSINCYKGNLYIYLFSFNHLKIIKLSEYEIIKNDDHITNYFDYDLSNVNETIVESFFEKLNKITFDNMYDPYLEENVYGTYQVTNVYEKEDASKIYVYSNLIIKPYTNFIDQGIYEKGKVLKFFGKCFINNEQCFFGKILSDVGTYNIELFDNLGNGTTYQIYIVDDYYKNTDDELSFNSACFKESDKTFEKVYNLPKNVVVTSVILDDQEYANYSQKNSKLIIKFDTNSKEVEKHVLNFINYHFEGSDEIYSEEIGEIILIKTLKQALMLDVNKTLNKDNVNLSFDVEDTDQSFMYLKVTSSSNNGKIINDIIYSNQKYTNKEKSEYLTKITLYYNDGVQTFEEDLCKFKITNYRLNFEVNFSYDGKRLKNITIIYDTPKNYSNISLINVLSTDLSTIYKNVEPNYLIRNIVLISFATLFISVIFHRIRVRNKKNKRKIYI